jgi:hypothetical protein
MFFPSKFDAIIDPSRRARDVPEKDGETSDAKFLLWESDQDVAARRAIGGPVKFFPTGPALGDKG